MTTRRDPGTIEEGGWFVWRIAGSEPIAFAPGVKAPAEFEVFISATLAQRPISLTIAMDPEKGAVPVAIGPGPSREPLTPVSYVELDQQLRTLDVDLLLCRAAARAIWMLAEPGEHGTSWEERLALLDSTEQLIRSRPRRHSINTGHLTEVAQVYRHAVDSGAPTKAVAKAFHATRSTAGRWVVLARREGLLGPADRTRAGEASP